MRRVPALALVMASALMVFLVPGAAAREIAVLVHDTIIGRTPEYLGAVEGGHWNAADLVDCGMRSVRLYCDMSRIEPADDDGVYGSPSPAQIEADPGIIDWEVWEKRLHDPGLWGTGISLAKILADCAAEGIQPLLCLRNRDIYDMPDWAPEPPFDEQDANEWWEFCFALAYWCNVRHKYGFFEWQCHNEPDLSSQGWTGTGEEYGRLAHLMYAAVSCANNLAGVTTWLHLGNVAAPGTMLEAALRTADRETDVIDYHSYDYSQMERARTVARWISMYDPDGKRGPLWCSEWGTYTLPYGPRMAMIVARGLYEFAVLDTTLGDHMRGTSVFVMWDWGDYDGLVNADGSRNPAYYVHRLMNRCLNGGKDLLRVTGAGAGMIAAMRDRNNLYLVVVDDSAVCLADLAALGMHNAAGTLYYYSEKHPDVVVANPPVTAGKVCITGVAGGVALLVVPRGV